MGPEVRQQPPLEQSAPVQSNKMIANESAIPIEAQSLSELSLIAPRAQPTLSPMPPSPQHAAELEVPGTSFLASLSPNLQRTLSSPPPASNVAPTMAVAVALGGASPTPEGQPQPLPFIQSPMPPYWPQQQPQTHYHSFLPSNHPTGPIDTNLLPYLTPLQQQRLLHYQANYRQAQDQVQYWEQRRDHLQAEFNTYSNMQHGMPLAEQQEARKWLTDEWSKMNQQRDHWISIANQWQLSIAQETLSSFGQPVFDYQPHHAPPIGSVTTVSAQSQMKSQYQRHSSSLEPQCASDSDSSDSSRSREERSISHVTSASSGVSATDELKDQKVKKKRKRGVSKKERDPDAPKKPLTSYMIFHGERLRHQSRLKARSATDDHQHHSSNQSAASESKVSGELWQAMTAEQKLPYEQRYKEDRAVYEQQYKEYAELKSAMDREGTENKKVKKSKHEIVSERVRDRRASVSVSVRGGAGSSGGDGDNVKPESPRLLMSDSSMDAATPTSAYSVAHTFPFGLPDSLATTPSSARSLPALSLPPSPSVAVSASSARPKTAYKIFVDEFLAVHCPSVVDTNDLYEWRKKAREQWQSMNCDAKRPYNVAAKRGRQHFEQQEHERRKTVDLDSEPDSLTLSAERHQPPIIDGGESIVTPPAAMRSLNDGESFLASPTP